MGLLPIRSSRRSSQPRCSRTPKLSLTHQESSILEDQQLMPDSLEEKLLLIPMVDGAHMEVVLSPVKTHLRSIDPPLTTEDSLPNPLLPMDSPTEFWSKFLMVSLRKVCLTMISLESPKIISASDQVASSRSWTSRDQFTKNLLLSATSVEQTKTSPGKPQK